MVISGSVILSASICERQAWLMGHGILPDQDNPYIELGRFIHETSYRRERGEIELPGMKVDFSRVGPEKIVIVEIKKSSKSVETGRVQLLYYLWRLKRKGLRVTGEIRIPWEKRIIKVELDREAEELIASLIEKAKEILSKEVPPPPKRIYQCKSCGYFHFCWA